DRSRPELRRRSPVCTGVDRESNLARFVIPVVAVAIAIAPAAIHAAPRLQSITRNRANPLRRVPASTNGNPLAGARFFVDPYSHAAALARRYRRAHPSWSGLLSVIAVQPGTARFA